MSDSNVNHRTMTDKQDEKSEGDHPSLETYPIDEEYLDVERKRADISVTETDEEPPLDRASAAEGNADTSYRYGLQRGTLAATDIDEMIDESAVWDNDGRSQTRTGFDARESNDPKRWRRLNVLNDGWRAPERKEQNYWADRQRWIETFAGHLDMSTTDKERIKHIIGNLEMSHMAHYSSQKVILAVISLVANEHGRWIRDEEMFRSLLEDTGTNLYEIKRIRRLVKRKSDDI